MNETARELAAAIRSGEVSSLELVRAHLDRIEAVNSAVNAIVTLAPDVEERARAADAALARGEATGSLHGVPVTIKDGFDTAGVRTTRGSRLFADHVPDRDATVVTRLKAAGAIPIGKTNVPDLMLWAETDNLVFGRTSNPWDLSRTAGGSSGGEAAAVAAGLSPLGVGSCLAGSIRLPAHFCGVVGFKPTHGVVPLTGHFGEGLRQWMHTGFLARSTDDVAIALAACAGPDGEDWHAVPVPDSVLAPAAPSRVGLLPASAFGPCDEEVAVAARRAAEALAANGYDVEGVAVPALERHDWNLLTLVLFGVGGARYMNATIAGREELLHPILRRRIGRPPPSLDEYVAAQLAAEDLCDDLAAAFAEHDVLLGPTAPVVAHPHGATEVAIGGEAYMPRAVMRGTAPFNLTGSPALTVPFERGSGGLPIGVQLVGRRFEDAAVLRAGADLESARGPWDAPEVAACV